MSVCAVMAEGGLSRLLMRPLPGCVGWGKLPKKPGLKLENGLRKKVTESEGLSCRHKNKESAESGSPHIQAKSK